MSNDLLRWRKEASSVEWSKLADLAETSVGYLDQIAYGFRRASPSKAKQIEAATKKFESITPVTKEDLVFAAVRATAA
ncbi:transcriptional regulator [Serratia sp. N21D137]|uniref:transcriptional regulator n=1 Tax=Serratia sp. N21D137 TaxID=3397495 RepID=UPI0039DF82E7